MPLKPPPKEGFPRSKEFESMLKGLPSDVRDAVDAKISAFEAFLKRYGTSGKLPGKYEKLKKRNAGSIRITIKYRAVIHLDLPNEWIMVGNHRDYDIFVKKL